MGRLFLFGRGGERVGLEVDDGFVRLGVTEFFAGEAADGVGIIAQRVNVGAQALGNVVLFLQFGIELKRSPPPLS